MALLPPFVPPPRALFEPSLLRFFLPILIHGFSDIRESARLSQALGDRHGVQPLGLRTFLSAPGDLSISYTSSSFHLYAEHVDPSVQFIGRNPEKEPDEIEALLGVAS